MLGNPELVVTLRRLLTAGEDIEAEFGRVHLAECRAKSIAAGFGQNTAALPSATSGCPIGQPGVPHHGDVESANADLPTHEAQPTIADADVSRQLDAARGAASR